MAVFVPFLSFSLLRSYADERMESKFIKSTAWRYILVAFLSLAVHRLPFHHTLRPISRYYKYQDEYISRQNVIDQLKGKDVRIAAPNNWIPHLTAQKSVAMAAVWIDTGRAGDVDVWIWDEKSDNFPSKLSTVELQDQVKLKLDYPNKYQDIIIDKNVRLWYRTPMPVNLLEFK